MEAAELELRGVDTVLGGRLILKNITLRVQPGEIISVIGPGTATRNGRSTCARAKRNSSTMPSPCGASTRPTTW